MGVHAGYVPHLHRLIEDASSEGFPSATPIRQHGLVSFIPAPRVGVGPGVVQPPVLSHLPALCLIAQVHGLSWLL